MIDCILFSEIPPHIIGAGLHWLRAGSSAALLEDQVDCAGEARPAILLDGKLAATGWHKGVGLGLSASLRLFPLAAKPAFLLQPVERGLRRGGGRGRPSIRREQINRFQKTILAALHGVEPFDPDQHRDLSQDLTRLLIAQKEPVSRFLELALVLHGRKLYTGDKTVWKAYIVFKGSVGYIHDWKHASWTLYGPGRPLLDGLGHL